MFLSDTASERVTFYQDIKRAYTVRSKVVHGDEMDTKQQAHLFEVSTKCDDLLRRAFHRILSDEAAQKALKSGKNDIDAYFLKRILGAEVEKRFARWLEE